MGEIFLHNGSLTAGIDPAAGGSISRLQSLGAGEITNWLRPADYQTLADGDPLGMASFPLVPFSNRIRDGKFSFQGKAVTLPLNFGDHPHVIHGHGWQNGWSVENRSITSLELSYQHNADDWPWSYGARQVFSLTETALTIEISVANSSDSDMPVGLGLHPYFPRTPGATITADVQQMWQVDEEVMPLELVTVEAPADPRSGLDVNSVVLDNGFTGWDGRAEISWPERDRKLVMTASGQMDQLVIFTPPGEDFFCVEPVSHGTDAVNADAEDRGVVVLEPGQTMSAEVKFELV